MMVFVESYEHPWFNGRFEIILEKIFSSEWICLEQRQNDNNSSIKYQRCRVSDAVTVAAMRFKDDLLVLL